MKKINKGGSITTILLVSAFIIKVNLSFAQTVKTLCIDGSLKAYSSYDFKSHVDICTDGTRILFNDITGKIIVEADMRNCHKDGVYKRFYDSGIIKEFGTYKAGKRDGFFYFWNKQGDLLRKEKWKDGKKIW